MSNHPSVKQMFEYDPNAISLRGFPYNVSVLNGIRRTLGLETLLRRHQANVLQRDRVIEPSFPLEHVEARQDFFKRIGSSRVIKKVFFDRGLPRSDKLKNYYPSDEFPSLCDKIYDILETAKTELGDFKHTLEAQRIIDKVDGFDPTLKSKFEELRAIENASTFAIDTQKGTIAIIPEMPLVESVKLLCEQNNGQEGWNDWWFNSTRVKMKKQVVQIAKEAGVDMKRNVLAYAKKEFEFKPGRDNLRGDFEQLAMPIRLYSHYSKFFLEPCEDSASGAVYPNFEDYYDVKGLLPPKLMERYGADGSFTPINFKTKPSEKKFLIAGLHSGGKSFFLENIVLASVLGKTGMELLADSVVLPKYDNIFYYKNMEDGDNGKLDTELGEISKIINKAAKNDLVVIDEFLDSTSAEIANSLGPAILNKLAGLESTVFVTSHRSTDYNGLSKNGWAIMSPEYKIEDGKVIPTHSLRRGAPDATINERYVLQKYGKAFDV